MVEAEHRVMSASPAVLNKVGPGAGVDLGIAAAAGYRLGPGAAVNCVIA